MWVSRASPGEPARAPLLRVRSASGKASASTGHRRSRARRRARAGGAAACGSQRGVARVKRGPPAVCARTWRRRGRRVSALASQGGGSATTRSWEISRARDRVFSQRRHGETTRLPSHTKSLGCTKCRSHRWGISGDRQGPVRGILPPSLAWFWQAAPDCFWQGSQVKGREQASSPPIPGENHGSAGDRPGCRLRR
jgi:hypothetical protein